MILFDSKTGDVKVVARRVTDFRIDEVEIPEEQYYALPAEARKLIEAYATPLRAKHPDVLRFEIPVYRWQEIDSVMKRLK